MGIPLDQVDAKIALQRGPASSGREDGSASPPVGLSSAA